MLTTTGLPHRPHTIREKWIRVASHTIHFFLRTAPREARRRAAGAHVWSDGATTERADGRLANGMVWRVTFYAGLSAAPAALLILGGPWLLVGLVGVIAATIVETLLDLREQVIHASGLLLVRGAHVPDDVLLPLAIERAVGHPKGQHVRHVANVSLGSVGSGVLQELAESGAEIIAMRLGRRLVLRLSSRTALRAVPLLGFVVGAIISHLAGRHSVRRILKAVDAGPLPNATDGPGSPLPPRSLRAPIPPPTSPVRA